NPAHRPAPRSARTARRARRPILSSLNWAYSLRGRGAAGSFGHHHSRHARAAPQDCAAGSDALATASMRGDARAGRNTGDPMKARMDFRKASPQGARAIAELHAFVHRCGLDHALLELVKLRASQINGCAHCIDMHTKELRAAGEDEQRLYLLDAW